MKTSPTQRTIAELRKSGAVVGIVEHWNQWAKIRQDLFNFIDLIYLLGPNCVAVQCTSGTNHAARKAKILAEPKALAWLKAGNLIEVWSWSKKGAAGKRKLWEARKEEITLADFATSSAECNECGGTKRVTFRGRTLVCGACATDAISVAFRKTQE